MKALKPAAPQTSNQRLPACYTHTVSVLCGNTTWLALMKISHDVTSLAANHA
jgi:hypothetical protein